MSTLLNALVMVMPRRLNSRALASSLYSLQNIPSAALCNEIIVDMNSESIAVRKFLTQSRLNLLPIEIARGRPRKPPTPCGVSRACGATTLKYAAFSETFSLTLKVLMRYFRKSVWSFSQRIQPRTLAPKLWPKGLAAYS